MSKRTEAVEIRLPVSVMTEYEMVAKLAGVAVASVMKVALAQEVRRQQWAAVVMAEDRNPPHDP